MGILQHLVQCPECKCDVRFDRLKTHLKKIHKTPIHNTDQFTKKIASSSRGLTIEKINKVSALINCWLKTNKNSFYKIENVKVLTVMTFEDFMGYSFDEINRFCNVTISNEDHKVKTSRFKKVYEQMLDNLYESLIYHKKNYVDQRSKAHYYFQGAANYSEQGDWYTFNSVDRMDGSKYIGYQCREYENSRFGSFPIHDDYGEEAWADDNPWE